MFWNLYSLVFSQLYTTEVFSPNRILIHIQSHYLSPLWTLFGLFKANSASSQSHIALLITFFGTIGRNRGSLVKSDKSFFPNISYAISFIQIIQFPYHIISTPRIAPIHVNSLALIYVYSLTPIYVHSLTPIYVYSLASIYVCLFDYIMNKRLFNRSLLCLNHHSYNAFSLMLCTSSPIRLHLYYVLLHTFVYTYIILLPIYFHLQYVILHLFISALNILYLFECSLIQHMTIYVLKIIIIFLCVLHHSSLINRRTFNVAFLTIIQCNIQPPPLPSPTSNHCC